MTRWDFIFKLILYFPSFSFDKLNFKLYHLWISKGWIYRIHIVWDWDLSTGCLNKNALIAFCYSVLLMHSQSQKQLYNRKCLCVCLSVTKTHQIYWSACLSAMMLISHHAHQPWCLSSIMLISHHAHQPSCPLAFILISHQILILPSKNLCIISKF